MTQLRRTLPLLLVALGACAPPRADHAAAVVAVHARILQAHRDRDAAAWTALEADSVTVGSRGEWFVSTRADRLTRRENYLRATRFTVYRDVRAPIVRVADDGSLAWLYANVEVVAWPDTAGATDSTHTIWAWIELYERRADRWLLVGNVSNERPGPLP